MKWITLLLIALSLFHEISNEDIPTYPPPPQNSRSNLYPSLNGAPDYNNNNGYNLNYGQQPVNNDNNGARYPNTGNSGNTFSSGTGYNSSYSGYPSGSNYQSMSNSNYPNSYPNSGFQNTYNNTQSNYPNANNRYPSQQNTNYGNPGARPYPHTGGARPISNPHQPFATPGTTHNVHNQTYNHPGYPMQSNHISGQPGYHYNNTRPIGHTGTNSRQPMYPNNQRYPMHSGMNKDPHRPFAQAPISHRVNAPYAAHRKYNPYYH